MIGWFIVMGLLYLSVVAFVQVYPSLFFLRKPYCGETSYLFV